MDSYYLLQILESRLLHGISWCSVDCRTSMAVLYNCVRAAPYSRPANAYRFLLFSLVLYLIYFPPHLKYVNITSLTVPWSHDMVTTEHVASTEWRTATIAGFTTMSHFLFITFTTFFLILTDPSTANTPSKPYPMPSPNPTPDPTYPTPYPSERIALWATFLGVLSTTLAVVQYAPQLWTTWKAKTVGALSIPMMCIQTPGAVLMVISIAVRPGTNWTSWATYAAAGIMQGSLLVMCICWKVRQRRLDIDDFGRPLHSHGAAAVVQDHVNQAVATASAALSAAEENLNAARSERTPLLGNSGNSQSAQKKPWYEFWKN
jgi:hypothetical protein